jgi:predicted nucleotidyltransferase
MNTQNITSRLEKHMYSMDNIVFAYLFGSYVKGTQSESSDVDIALYLKDSSLDSKLQTSYELSKLLKKDVDLVVVNEVKNIYLLEDIIYNSIVLKDSESRFDFELSRQHDILDFKEFKRMMDVA